MEQPLDVLAVAEQRQQRCKDGEADVGPVVGIAAQQHSDAEGVDHGHGDGAQRHVAGEGRDEHHHGGEADAQPGVDGQDHAQGGRDALAALEFEERREVVAQDGRGAADQQAHVPRQIPAQLRRDEGLQAVAHQRQHAGQPAQVAQHVGGAGVAAAHLADVLDAVELRNQDAHGDVAQQIADHGDQQILEPDSHCFSFFRILLQLQDARHCSSFFFSRRMKRSGVPSKPKDLRNCFSR